MIQVEELYFGYQKKADLFSDLELELKAGPIYGLLGRNGAGKSSLLQLICGLLFPDSGSVTVAGLIPARRKPEFLQQLFLSRKKSTCRR